MEDLKDIEMKDFYAMHVTDKGLALLTKIMAREIPLKFTRVSAGDGVLPEGADPYKMTALVNRLIDLPICSKQDGGGVAVISCYQTSKGLTEPYDSREIGLYADDPDEGEILYAYFNAGNRPDFIPSERSPVVVDWLLSLVTIVGRAAIVEAVIDQNIVFVSHYELDTRIDELFDRAAPIFEFWTRTQGDDKKLRPASIADVKKAIFDEFETGDIRRISRRLDYLENAVGEVLLELEVKEIYPDYVRYIIEDFRNLAALQTDPCKCIVTSIVAGDRSLEVESLDGIIPLSWYTLADGIRHEAVCVKSCNIENGIRRIILTAPIRHTYVLADTRLYRSSAVVRSGVANGPIGVQTLKWDAVTEWRGNATDTPVSFALPTNLANAGKFILEGTTGFTSDGLVTLIGG